MRGVDVARLHRDHVGDELRGWGHGRLEEVHDRAIEALAQLRVAAEGLDLAQELTQNTDELLVDELTALERGILEPLDLLLDDDLERSGANEERRRRTLSACIR